MKELSVMAMLAFSFLACNNYGDNNNAPTDTLTNNTIEDSTVVSGTYMQ